MLSTKSVLNSLFIKTSVKSFPIGVRHLSSVLVRNPARFSQAATAYPGKLFISRSNMGFFSFSTGTSRVIDTPAQNVDYDEVKAIVEKNDPNVIIVDVREPDEFNKGHIPNAVNIPFKSMPGALGLEPAEFESTLGFAKPSVDKTLLFYCQGGVRCTSSEQLASTYNYTKRMNYKGSYQDWENHTKSSQNQSTSAH